MVNLNLPKTHDFGFGELVELKHLETTFGVTRLVALKYLKALRIKPLYFNNEIFFCLSTFNRILYVLSKPGSPGFIFPGSTAKRNKSKQLRKKGFLTEVTDEILEQASSPQVMAEMAAATGRDPSMIKKLVSANNAKARKEQK